MTMLMLIKGRAKGLGKFYPVKLPLMGLKMQHHIIYSYKKLDLRTVSFDVPPQEVSLSI